MKTSIINKPKNERLIFFLIYFFLILFKEYLYGLAFSSLDSFEAVKKAKPVLLEPFVKLHISIPTDMIGDISSDLSGRRGRIIGTEMMPGDQALLEAEAPLSEVMSYTSQLKSITGGTGSYEMEYSHDERTPANVQADVVKAFKPDSED